MANPHCKMDSVGKEGQLSHNTHYTLTLYTHTTIPGTPQSTFFRILFLWTVKLRPIRINTYTLCESFITAGVLAWSWRGSFKERPLARRAYMLQHNNKGFNMPGQDVYR
jgi:hypothetical protein